MLEPVPGPEDRPHSQPLTWEARGIPLTHVAWPRADESLQWRCSRDLVRLLQARGNRVWVLISPFNPHLLTPASRELHGRLLQDVCAWLQSAGVPFSRGTPPPSTEYADASHPLAAGYERLAREMLGDPEFDAWLQAASTPAR
jgi:hypothetical protein